MTVPALLKDALSIPAIDAPMFLVSLPPLVKALCEAGVIGAFPHVNARPSSQLDEWLTDVQSNLEACKAANPGATVAPVCVNLIVHRTNPRYQPDLEIVVRHQVPLVITCPGNLQHAIETVHGYDGVMFRDVINAPRARKAIAAAAS